MAIRRILRIDDPADKKILKMRCRPVQLPNPSLKQLVADMFATMRAAGGVGLAAPQIGITQRLTVIAIPAEVEEREDGARVELAPAQDYVLVNPEIVKASDEHEIVLDGCLSLPGW